MSFLLKEVEGKTSGGSSLPGRTDVFGRAKSHLLLLTLFGNPLVDDVDV